MNFSPLPSPAVSFIGRKNSGKTTLLEKIIANLSQKGLRVATIKHHGHPDFDIDIPGRDSFRHRAAGAQSSTILSDVRYAQITELSAPLACEEVASQLSFYDIVLVEGFKQAHIPSIELFRADNPRDIEAAKSLAATWEQALQEPPQAEQIEESAQTAQTAHAATMRLPAAVVTDIASVKALALQYHLPCFTYDDIEAIARFVQETFARPQLSVVIQAGGESKRMGTPKEVVSFLGKPLIFHALERVSPLANELIITTNNPDRLSFVKNSFPQVQLVSDKLEQRGAIPGLYTALSSAQQNAVAVVACDMVDIPTALLASESLLLRPCENPQFDALIPKTKTGFEPFAGVYRSKTCLPKLEQFITQGHTDAPVRVFLDLISCGFIDCTSPLKCARFGGSFLNINTPEDVAEATRQLCHNADCVL